MQMIKQNDYYDDDDDDVAVVRIYLATEKTFANISRRKHRHKSRCLQGNDENCSDDNYKNISGHQRH